MAEREEGAITHQKTFASSIRIFVALVVLFAFVLFIFPCWSHPILYWDEVSAASTEFGVPAYFIYAVIKTESGFRRNAVSPKGAVGLMQILPSTYEEIKQELAIEGNDLTEPRDNIRAGTYYLAKLYRKFGNWDIALAAYNAGIGAVSKWLEDDPTLESIPYPETDRYVILVNRAYREYLRLYNRRFS